MSNLFRARGDSAGSGSNLERELQAIERQVKTASPGYETQFLNRAGDLCVEAGQPERALGYYGRAIDAYLESGRFSAAEVACKKLLRIMPDAVRVRCTLAWLSIGKGAQLGTLQDVADYVRAARRTGAEELAVKQLLMMAEAAIQPEVREAIAEHLLRLGAHEEADRILGDVYAEQNQLKPPPEIDESRIWSRLLRAAMMGPEQLKGERVGARADDDSLPTLGR